MMSDGVEQQCIPRISGVQFPVAGLLEQGLNFFVIQLQTEGQGDHFIPLGILLAQENLVYIGFVQVGAPYHVGLGAALLF